jgi:trigger factor
MSTFLVPELADVKLPQVKAPSLEGLEVTVPAPKDFTAKEVQERFLELARPLANERYRYPNEPVAWRDEVLLSIVGISNGRIVPFSARKEVWLPLEPEPLLPGLYESLVGHVPNETVAVDLILPPEYPVESLRNQPARFMVQIHAAREVKYPELESPEFLQAFGRGSTLAEVMRSVYQQMEQETVQRLGLLAQQKVLDEVAARTEVKIPAALVDREILENWSASEGVTVRELGFSPEQQQESLHSWFQDPRTRAEVETRVRIGLALRAIREREGLQLTPERVEALLREHAAAAGVTMEQLAESLKAEPQQMARIDQMAWHLLVVEHVMSRAQVRFERA